MSYITRTGNLAAAPTLREGEKGPYTFARVLVSDRIKDGDNYVDGPAIGYDVSVSGQQAKALCELAAVSGNIRITFSGSYRVSTYTPDDGEPRLVHEVRADDVAVSLRGQTVTVERRRSE